VLLGFKRSLSVVNLLTFEISLIVHFIKGELDRCETVEPIGDGVPRKTHLDYLEACADCEITVVITTAEHKSKLRAMLFYDRRPHGAHGRALRDDMPIFGLLKGDRLEPSQTLQNISLMEEAALPMTLVFWRHSKDTIARHRNPIFSAATGVTVQACLQVDSRTIPRILSHLQGAPNGVQCPGDEILIV
jgi:hypothetical protein